MTIIARLLVAAVSTAAMLLAYGSAATADTTNAQPGTAGATSEFVKPAPVRLTGKPPADVSPMHCDGHAPHDDKDHRSYAQLFTGDSVNERNSPHVGCSSNGLGYRSHTVDYHCWRYGDNVTRNGFVYSTWTYLRNVTTGVYGWVSDAYLAFNADGTTGSTVHCDA